MTIITEDNYVDKADEKIKRLGRVANGIGRFDFRTTQIRKFLSITATIFDMAKTEEGDILSTKLREKLNYLKVQIIYQAGREITKVKPFIDQSQILEIIKEIKTRKDLLLFCKYMEALVAYHRYYGGKDS